MRLIAILKAGGFTTASMPLPELIDLTQREIQVLNEMGKGHGNADIAARLFVSEKTVKTHVNHIFMKLGVTNRVQAVLKLKQTEAESEGLGENTT